MNQYSQKQGKKKLTLPLKLLICLLFISVFTICYSNNEKSSISIAEEPTREEPISSTVKVIQNKVKEIELNDDLDDFDNDGIPDHEERRYDCDPFDPDSDDDGLLDGEEVYLYNSAPMLNDTDFDGLGDYVEVFVYQTSPIYSDTDFDFLCDSWEVFDYPTNPTIADTDGDSILDGVEIFHLKSNPMAEDSDYDMLNDYEEYKIYKTNYNCHDTDKDGISDGFEVFVYKTNPLSADTDGDNKNDEWELMVNRNPLVKDNWYNILSYVAVPSGILILAVFGLVAAVNSQSISSMLFKSKFEIKTEKEKATKQFLDLLVDMPLNKQITVNDLSQISGESIDYIYQLLSRIFDLPDINSGVDLSQVIIRSTNDIAIIEYTCFYCAASVTYSAEICTICQQPVVRCKICDDPISHADSYVQCTKCGVIGTPNKISGVIKTDLICESCYISYKYHYI
jgi:hypothetical protein